MNGWLIIHPDGSVETDYFKAVKFYDKGTRVSRETWLSRYRPDCRFVHATLLWDETDEIEVLREKLRIALEALTTLTDTSMMNAYKSNASRYGIARARMALDDIRGYAESTLARIQRLASRVTVP